MGYRTESPGPRAPVEGENWDGRVERKGRERLGVGDDRVPGTTTLVGEGIGGVRYFRVNGRLVELGRGLRVPSLTCRVGPTRVRVDPPPRVTWTSSLCLVTPSQSDPLPPPDETDSPNDT